MSATAARRFLLGARGWEYRALTVPAWSGRCAAGGDPGVDRARESVQREHDRDDHQPGDSAVDDLPWDDERRVVPRVPDAVDRGGDEEGVPDRGSPERA